MLEALKLSREPRADIELAKRYIVGVIGDLQRRKKAKEEKALVESNKHTFASNQAREPSAGRHPTLQTSSNVQAHASNGKDGSLSLCSNSG